MDEKEKEVKKDEAGDSVAAEATEETAEVTEVAAEAAAVEDVQGSAEAEAVIGAPEAKNKLHKALIRVGAAFVAALLLLAVTRLSIVDLIKGAKAADAVQDEEIGSFVKRDVFAILGFIDAKTADAAATDTTTDTSTTGSLTPADSTSGEYALVPMGGKFVTVHFTKRYLESAYAIEAQTYSYINGGVSTLDSYVTVEGTTKTISEDLSTKMYDWFALNKDWMVQAGVISDIDDNATYLSDVVFEVDTVKGQSEVFVIVLTGLAALCVLYIIVELILMATGFYLNGWKKKKAEDDRTEDVAAEEKDAAEDEATSAAEKAQSSEAETTESSEIQEDK